MKAHIFNFLGGAMPYVSKHLVILTLKGFEEIMFLATNICLEALETSLAAYWKFSIATLFPLRYV